MLLAMNKLLFGCITFMGEDSTEVSTNKTRARVFVSTEFKAEVFFVSSLVA